MSNLSPQFNNVFSLKAARALKEKTGTARAIRKTTPETPEETRRFNEAMELNKPAPKTYSKARKITNYLGLTPEE